MFAALAGQPLELALKDGRCAKIILAGLHAVRVRLFEASSASGAAGAADDDFGEIPGGTI